MKKKWLIVSSAILVSVLTLFLVLNYAKGQLDAIEPRSVKDIKIYKNTPAWALAQAVQFEKVDQIAEICKANPGLVDYEDPEYDASLLLWSVGMERYYSAEALLKAGANPDSESQVLGLTPLKEAASYSWIDSNFNNDARFVKLLIKYGADPNKWEVKGFYNPDGREAGYTPLMQSIGSGLEKTKALVEGGADVNQQDVLGNTAAGNALLKFYDPQYAAYLVIEAKADITKPYYLSESDAKNNSEMKFYDVDSLRSWVFDLDSKEYQMKMEIVKEFERQGVNYWQTEIPESVLEEIKQKYPDTWEYYIKKY